MPSKNAIIDNVEQYTARELADYIQDGVVTFKELCDETEGFFSAEKRKEVKRMLSQKEEREEKDWERAKSSDRVNGLEDYLKNYPKGKHRDEARELIKKLETASTAASNIGEKEDATQEDDSSYLDHSLKEEIKRAWADETASKSKRADQVYNIICTRGQAVKDELIDMIKEDPNILEASVVRRLCDQISPIGMTMRDLERAGIEKEFIKCMLEGKKGQVFPMSEKLKEIKKTSTEVYFWGIPDAGKTCALGAILSTASNGSVAKSMMKDINCQGYGYMTRLSSLFKTDGIVRVLPEKTPTTATYEMGFDLEDNKGDVHPITFIDLAGELMTCMYKCIAKELMQEEHTETLKTMTDILIDHRTKNRKIHFFVLEYGAENRQYGNLTQSDYIVGAMDYIKSKDVFKTDTDAIFLLVTKADKIIGNASQKKEKIIEYIKSNYQGFHDCLEKICRDNEINDGKVEIFHFSLGKICFQNYCLFDDKAAKAIVELLINRTKGFRSGRMGKIFYKLKG